jgi:integrase/recombinase XerD
MLSLRIHRSEVGPVSLIQPMNRPINTDPQPDWWMDLSESYLRSVMRRGRRPNTRRAYSYELQDFGHWLTRARVLTLSDLRRDHLEAWQDEQTGRKSPRTRMVAATALKGCLRWAADQELQLSSPTLWLRIIQPRAPEMQPRPIPQKDLALICRYFEQPDLDLFRLRARALFWVILSSGARITEALSLTRVSAAENTISVIQKGGSIHQLVISETARTAAGDYLRARADRAPALFIMHGHGRPLEALNKKWAQRAWDDLCAELHIQRFTSHQIRHSCATELLRQGVNPLVIAKHMGHHGLATIRGYAQVDLDERLDAMRMLDSRLSLK